MAGGSHYLNTNSTVVLKKLNIGLRKSVSCSPQLVIDRCSNYHARNSITFSEVFSYPAHISRKLPENLVCGSPLLQLYDDVLLCRAILGKKVNRADSGSVLTPNKPQIAIQFFSKGLEICFN